MMLRWGKSWELAQPHLPFPHYEVDNGTVVKYYFFGGQRIAMDRGGAFKYLHTDHLGSTVMETDNTGAMTASQQYCAYGKKRTLSSGTWNCGSGNSLATAHTFTGQKLDGSGLQFYNARYYDPSIGTFISADTIVPSPGTVVSYNRFAYANLNPMNLVDPSGHCTLASNAIDESDRKANVSASGGMYGCWWVYYSLLDQGIPGLDWQWDYALGISVESFAAQNALGTGGGDVMPLAVGLSLGGYDVLGYALLSVDGYTALINGTATFHAFYDSKASYYGGMNSLADGAGSLGMQFAAWLNEPSGLGRVDKLVPFSGENKYEFAQFASAADSYSKSVAQLTSGAAAANITWTSFGIAANFWGTRNINWLKPAGPIGRLNKLATARSLLDTPGAIGGMFNVDMSVSKDLVVDRLNSLPTH